MKPKCIGIIDVTEFPLVSADFIEKYDLVVEVLQRRGIPYFEIVPDLRVVFIDMEDKE